MGYEKGLSCKRRLVGENGRYAQGIRITKLQFHLSIIIRVQNVYMRINLPFKLCMYTQVDFLD